MDTAPPTLHQEPLISEGVHQQLLRNRDKPVSSARLPGKECKDDPGLPPALRLVLNGRCDGWLDGHAARWGTWDAFADHHHLDPERPADHHLVAFVEARARAGVSIATLSATLTTVRLALEHTEQLTDTSVTIPAVRRLRQLWDDGQFDPTTQAPLLTLGQVAGLAAATDRASRRTPTNRQQLLAARDRMLVAVGYCAALRPGEWVWPDRDHLGPTTVRGRHAYRLMLPRTKTNSWVPVTVTSPPGLPAVLDPVAAIEAYLAQRGDEPGPLVIDPAVPDGRLRPDAIQAALRSAAAAAGTVHFSSYSLRRSRATHLALAGASSPTIRRLLRHQPGGAVVRRYIEPLLAVMDRDRAAAHFLDQAIPATPPVELAAVSGNPHRRRPQPYAFAAGTLDELLADIELPTLRVPSVLVPLASSTIEGGRQAFRRWSTWAQSQNVDPTGPGEHDLMLWALRLLDAGRPAASVVTELAAVIVGWADATRSSQMPGHDLARQLLDGAMRDQNRQATPDRHVATDEDAATLLPSIAAPGRAWAAAVLLAVCRPLPGQNVTVLEVGTDHVDVTVGGKHRKLRRGPGDLVCPVAAAELLVEAGIVDLNGAATWEEVVRLGRRRSESLRNRLLICLLRGSGARPSDLRRARFAGLAPQPGGLAVVLGARKGRRPGSRVVPELLWAPQRDDDLDPLAALEEWQTWWPYDDGPLLPPLGRPAETAAGDIKTWNGLNAHLTAQIAAAGLAADGLTSRSFRFAVATEAVEAGTDLEAIAERLGHTDSRTTRGYIARWDPFVGDGLDDEQLVSIVGEVSS